MQSNIIQIGKMVEDTWFLFAFILVGPVSVTMKSSMFDASFYHQDSYEFDVNGIQDLKKGYVNVHITYLF